MPAVVGIVAGSSNAGKTTLIEKLVGVLKEKGYRVGVVKHTHHRVEPDAPGKDTWRFDQAGAEAVALITPERINYSERRSGDFSLDDVVTRLESLDLLIVEGFKKARIPKIEVFRHGVQDKIATPPGELIALVGNEPLDYHGIPWFSWNDPEGLAILIEKEIMGVNHGKC